SVSGLMTKLKRGRGSAKTGVNAATARLFCAKFAAGGAEGGCWPPALPPDRAQAIQKAPAIRHNMRVCLSLDCLTLEAAMIFSFEKVVGRGLRAARVESD